MPKRSCPWTQSAAPQRKTLVTERAQAGEEGRKEVYERTQALLFSGARSLSYSCPPAASASPTTAPPLQGSVRGQLRLGPRGELLRSPPTPISAPPGSPPCAACSLCLRPLTLARSPVRCARCERAMCGLCQRNCAQCLQDYCFSCCTPSYEGPYEVMVCADCPPPQ
ncbi:apoptosis regulatory protein Siva [Amia ocellicauda]|uniref:apoptosis regulatory protein Siva n=1 Tax=Amia ocellicauda TaxID=2972642 RepID=UPI003464B105|nr:SIVA protein [Amia calva]